MRISFRRIQALRFLATLLLAAACASCSLTGSGIGTTIGGAGNQPGDAKHPFAFDPPVTAPPLEYYAAKPAPQGNVNAGWLLNSVETLPSVSSVNDVYQNASLQSWADQIFAGVNALRAANGLAPVKRDLGLTVVAQAHARDMALRKYFSHTNPEGMYVWQRWEAVSVPNYRTGGENLAVGQETVAELLNEWATSQKHRENILQADSNYAGVGVYFDDANYDNPIHIALEIAGYKTDPAANHWTFTAAGYLAAH